MHFATPKEVLRAALDNKANNFLPQKLPMPVQNDLRLLQHVIECTVRGNLGKNIRPYIQFDRARYTNDKLANSYFLLNKTVVVYVDRRDPRNAQGTVKETGEQLGPLIVENRWAAHLISLRDRKLINRSGLALRINKDHTDPVADFCKLKKRELVNQRKIKRLQNRSSKDALIIARLPPSAHNADSSDKLLTLPMSEKIHGPDPFGLNSIPILGQGRSTL